MGLYTGLSAMACEERCREAGFRDKIRRGHERGEAESAQAPASPQAFRAETAGSATSVVKTGTLRNGLAAKVFGALSGLWQGNRSER